MSQYLLRRVVLLGIGTVLLGLSLFTSESVAQEFIQGPSMAPDDPKSMLSNPAVISFRRSHVGLGVKGHHVGIGNESNLPLREGYFSASTPFLFQDVVGAGGTIQYFDSPTFRQQKFGLSVSGQFFRLFSVGVRVSALNLSYKESEFVGVEPGDPVLEGGTGTTAFSGDIGVLVQPISNLKVGFGARDVNEPNIALGEEGFPMKMKWYGGVSYGVGPVRARGEFVDDRFGGQLRFSVEGYQSDGSYLRVGSNSDLSMGHAEGRLHVGGPLSVGYRYELPVSDLQGASSGSHSFSVTYEFGRTPEVPDPPELPPSLLDAQRTEVGPEYPTKVHVASDEKYLQHYEKRIEREINVPDEALRALSREEVGMTDTTFGSNRGLPQGESVEPPSDDVQLADLVTDVYDMSLEEIQRRLAENPENALVLQAKGEELVKAMGVRNRLLEEGIADADQIRIEEPVDSSGATPVDPDEIPRTEQVSFLNPESTRLHVLAPYLNNDDGEWELIVQSDAGQVVRTFTGLGEIPDRLEWDWTDNEGDPIDEGVYTYRFSWTGPNGERRLESNERTFYVRKVERNVTIEITQDPSEITEPADGVELQLER